MKIISIDIETTGVNPGTDQIVQVGAVAFDTSLQIFKPFLFEAIICHPRFEGQATALNMNIEKIVRSGGAYPIIKRKLEVFQGNWTNIPEMNVTNTSTVSVFAFPETLASQLKTWLNEIGFDGDNTINIAGKNVAGFDLQFLCKLPEWYKNIRWRRRVLDPAILFVNDGDVCMPDLKECLTRGFGVDRPIAHTAAADALDVAKLLYLKLHHWEQGANMKQVSAAIDTFDELNLLTNQNESLWENIKAQM